MVGAAGIYYLFSGGMLGQSDSSVTCTTALSYTQETIKSTVTTACGGGGNQRLTSTFPGSGALSSYASSSSASTGLLTFHGHYSWSSTTNSSGTTEVLSASGTFVVTIDLRVSSGSGTGQGTVDDTFTGKCTGHSSTSYTFDVGGDMHSLNGNLTLAFGIANPPSGTTSITCTDSGGSTSSFGFLSVVPLQATLPAIDGASVHGMLAGTDYKITLA